MPNRHAFYSASISVILLFGCAHRAEREKPVDWTSTIETLQREATADSLLAAALVSQFESKDSRSALSLLDQSLAIDPKQADTAWLALNICGQTPGCATEPRAATLLRLDPQNAAANYWALIEARKANDEVAEDGALVEMAKGEYFDVYWTRLTSRVADSLARVRGADQRPLRKNPDATLEVSGWLAAIGIPAFKAVAQSCKGDRLKREDILQSCRKISRALENGDAIIAQAIGRSVGLNVWPTDSTETKRILAEKREYDYAMAMYRQSDEAPTESEASVRDLLVRYRANRREIDVYRQWLADRGLPVTPPADWTPKTIVQ